MEKIDNFELAISYLKRGIRLIRSREDIFFYQNGKVTEYKKGSRFLFPLSEFTELFSEENFYLYEEDDPQIDPLKDEEYYTRYHK